MDSEFVPYWSGRCSSSRFFRPSARSRTRPLAPAGVWSLRLERAGYQGVVPTPGYSATTRSTAIRRRPPVLLRRSRLCPLRRGDLRSARRRDHRRRGPGSGGDADPGNAREPFNAIATSTSVITAGGFQERDCRIAAYSAGGPNTPPEAAPPYRRKPDALLPSEGSSPPRRPRRRFPVGRAGGDERHQRRRTAVRAICRRSACGRTDRKPRRSGGRRRRLRPSAPNPEPPDPQSRPTAAAGAGCRDSIR